MKQYGTAPGQHNYTPDFLQHFDQKDGGERGEIFSSFQTILKLDLFPGQAASQSAASGEVSSQPASVQQQQLQSPPHQPQSQQVSQVRQHIHCSLFSHQSSETTHSFLTGLTSGG